MKNKKCEYYPDEFWSKEFDYDEEYLIYQYLCGSIKKRKIRRVNEQVRFTRYAAWKAYVYNKFKGEERLQLKEFIRYLNNKNQKLGGIKNIINVVAIPFLVTGTVETLNRYFDIFDQLPIDFTEVFAMAMNVQPFLAKLVVVIIALVLYILIIVLTFSLPMCMIWIMFDAYRLAEEAEQKKRFIEDYQEIINELIMEKK